VFFKHGTHGLHGNTLFEDKNLYSHVLKANWYELSITEFHCLKNRFGKFIFGKKFTAAGFSGISGKGRSDETGIHCSEICD